MVSLKEGKSPSMSGSGFSSGRSYSLSMPLVGAKSDPVSVSYHLQKIQLYDGMISYNNKEMDRRVNAIIYGEPGKKEDDGISEYMKQHPRISTTSLYDNFNNRGDTNRRRPIELESRNRGLTFNQFDSGTSPRHLRLRYNSDKKEGYKLFESDGNLSYRKN